MVVLALNRQDIQSTPNKVHNWVYHYSEWNSKDRWVAHVNTLMVLTLPSRVVRTGARVLVSGTYRCQGSGIKYGATLKELVAFFSGPHGRTASSSTKPNHLAGSFLDILATISRPALHAALRLLLERCFGVAVVELACGDVLRFLLPVAFGSGPSA